LAINFIDLSVYIDYYILGA